MESIEFCNPGVGSSVLWQSVISPGQLISDIESHGHVEIIVGSLWEILVITCKLSKKISKVDRPPSYVQKKTDMSIKVSEVT